LADGILTIDMPNLSHAVRLRLNIHAWALLVLVIIEVLTNFLSENLTVGQLTPNEQLMPHRQLYDLWLGIIILCLLAAVILWTLNDVRRLRVAIFLLNGLFTLQLFVATVLIVVRLLQSEKVAVTTLLVDGFVIFVTNILVFSLWYWYIDSASTRFMESTIDRRWDFLFPQRQAALPGYENWQPRFWDYVFLAYTTSVAFSPADTLPLSRAAKQLTMTQSVIALIAITAVLGTAINIMAGSV
jgi:uncharacterized membrane protein